jgi:hypothetical protein
MEAHWFTAAPTGCLIQDTRHPIAPHIQRNKPVNVLTYREGSQFFSVQIESSFAQAAPQNTVCGAAAFYHSGIRFHSGQINRMVLRSDQADHNR